MASAASEMASAASEMASAASSGVDELESLFRRAHLISDGWESLRASSLEELNLSGWGRPLPSLQLDASHAPKLCTVHLASCDQLTAIRLELPQLRRLVATGCAALRSVVLECPKLTELSLNNSMSVSTLSVAHAHNLTKCALFGCRQLGRETLRALLADAAETLRSLNINGAIGTGDLAEADVRLLCPNLQHLDAKGRARKY